MSPKSTKAQTKKDEGKVVDAPAMFPAVREDSPAGMILRALDKNLDPEKVKSLLEAQERWEANEARKAYHKAMTAFKADPPSIEKDRKVAFKEVKYNHASLSNVTDKINEGLSKHGLSASWKTAQNGTISVTCRITHELGHSEETTLSAPSDTSGSKNAIQSIASTVTYLERYTLLALTGLAPHEMDDDGKSAGTEFITKEEGNALMDGLLAKNQDLDLFLSYLEVEMLSDLPKSKLKMAQEAIAKAKDKSK